MGQRGHRTVSVDAAGAIRYRDLFAERFLERVSAVWNICRVSAKFPYLTSAFDPVRPLGPPSRNWSIGQDVSMLRTAEFCTLRATSE